jgi:prepilin-type processing-associated H-X9-DG protein
LSLSSGKKADFRNPSIESQVVEIFAGICTRLHTFHEGGMQMLFLDGVKLAEGKFDPTTGVDCDRFLVKMPENELSADAENVWFCMTGQSEEEIKGLLSET